MLNGLIFMAEDLNALNLIAPNTDTTDLQLAEYRQAAQARDRLQAVTNILNSTDRSLGEAALDTGKNVAAGVLTGVTDTASFVTGLAGLDKLSQGIASVSDYIEKGAENLGSRGEQARRRWYQMEQAEASQKAQREYEQDVASGKSVLESVGRREAKNFFNSINNAFKTGHASEVISTGLGSVGSDILLTGGTSALAKTAAKALPTLAKSASALANTNKFTQGVAKNAPWMAAVGLQEGGNQYRQMLNDVLETENSQLMSKSPEFRARVEEKLSHLTLEQRANPSNVQAVMDQVKQEIAQDAAKESGIKTMLLASSIAPLTRWAQKPFEVGDRTGKRLLGEALTEPAEETITEAGGQVASNVATQHYLDPSQDTWEGTGESGALGGVGGLGMTAVRGAPAVAVSALGSGYEFAAHNTDRRAEQISKANEKYKNTFSGSGLDSAGEQVGKVYDKMQSFGKDLKDASIDDLRTIQTELTEVQDNLKNVQAETFAEEDRPLATKFSEQVNKQVSDLNRKVDQARATKFAEVAKKIKEDPSKITDSDIQTMESWVKDNHLSQGQSKDDESRAFLKNAVGEKSYNVYQQKLEEFKVKQKTAATEKFKKDTEGLKEGELTFERMYDIDQQASEQGLDLANKDYTGSDNPTNASLSEEAMKLPHQFSSAARNEESKITSGNDPKAQKTALAKAAWLTSKGVGTKESKQKQVFSLFDSYAKDDSFIPESGLPISAQQDLRNLYEAWQASKSSKPAPKVEPKVEPTPTPVPTPAPQPKAEPKPNPQPQPAPAKSNVIKDWTEDEISSLGNQTKVPATLFDGSEGVAIVTPSGTFLQQGKGSKLFIKLEEAAQTNTPVAQPAKALAEALQKKYNKQPEEKTPEPAKEPVEGKKSSETKEEQKPVENKNPTTEPQESKEPANLRDKNLDLTKCSDTQLTYILLDNQNPHQKNALDLLKYRKCIFIADADGEVSAERVDVSSKEYIDEMLEGLSDRFTPLTRSIQLLRSDLPLDMMNKLLSDTGKLHEVLKKNNSITADALIKRLHANNDELLHDLDKWLDRDGIFAKELTEGISKRFAKFSAFKNVNQRKLTDLAVIVGAHILATTAVMQHQNLMPILEKYGYKSDDGSQPNLEQIEGGYLLQALTDNAQTVFRKFMGVGIADDANLKEANTFLAQGAQAVLETLVEKGYLETFKVGLNKDILNDSGYRETVEEKAKFIRPAEDFGGKNRIFKREAGILEAILDTNFKNVIHTQIPSASYLIANTSQVITPEQVAQLHAYNKVPYRVNDKLMALHNRLGADGMYSLFNEQVSDADMPYRNAKDFASSKGKRLSYDQSVTFVTAADELNANIFFRNVILRNARAMQQGAVTPQNSKHCRAFMSPVHDLMNISDRTSDMYKFWSLGIAQKWGAKTNGMDKAIWSAKVTKFADEVLQPNLEKFDYLYEVTTNVPETAIGKQLKKFLGNQEQRELDASLAIRSAIAEFNKLSDDFQITDLEGLNALIEMVQYLQDESGRKNFDSDVFIEIDGINDGPHHISAFYGAIFENFNSESMKRLTQTGIYTGVEANATQINDADLLDDEIWEERKKLLDQKDIDRIEEGRKYLHKFWGVTGKDFHRQVAEKAIPKYLCNRIVAFNQTNNSVNKALGKRALKAALTLLKATGYLKTDKSIKELINMKEMPENEDYGFTFTRDISKKLTTIIPYGSQAKGSMRQIVDMIFSGYKNNPGIYSMISGKLGERTDNKVTKYRLEYLDNFRKAFEGKKSFIIDTETTGTDTANNKVVQIALQEVNGGSLKGKPIIIYINTDEHGQKIPEKINGEVNPLLEAYAKNKSKAVSAKEAGEQLQKILGDAPIFGHNITSFDIAILNQHLGIDLKNKAYDSLELARILRPGREASLQKLAQAFNLSSDGSAHLADSDIKTNFHVIDRLIEQATDSFVPKVTLEEGTLESTDDFNGVEWEEVQEAVNTLGSLKYNRNMGQYQELSLEERAKNVKHWTSFFPSSEELLDINKPFVVRGKKIYQKEGTDKDGKDIQNLDIPQNAEVTSLGMDNMAKLLEVGIGEPAQKGVEETLGESAIRTERVSMAIGQIVSLVAKYVEKHLGRPKTMRDLIKYRTILNGISGTLDINGTRAFIEKTGYNNDSEVTAHSDELGIDFHTSISHIADSGVAGGALSIQAGGDATMVRILATLLNSVEARSFKHIFDGLDTHVSQLGFMERMANLASAKTIESHLLAAVQDMLLNCGKNAMALKSLNLKATDPYEAVKEILDRAIQDDTDGENVAYNILRANNSLQQDISWLADPVSSVNRRRQNNEDTRVMKGMVHRKAQVNKALDELFSTTKVLVASEASAKAVDKQVPISVNHMCAVGIPYAQRGVLSNEAMNDLLQKVKDLGVKGLNDLNDLMGAFKATLRLASDLTEKVTKGLNAAEKSKYVSLLHSFPLSVKAQTLPPAAMDIVSEAFKVKKEQADKKLHEDTQEFQTKALVSSLLSRADKHEKSSWGPVLERVAKLLPDVIKNGSMNFVASVEDLPTDVQSHFGPNTLGYCDLKTGNLWIIADPEKGVTSLSQKDKQVLIHELIHATIAYHVNSYYKLDSGKGINLTIAQKGALNNLDHLLDQFVQMDLTDKPKTLQNLQNYLKNGAIGSEIDNSPVGKARRMNEALAYILAEEPLLKDLMKLKMDSKVLETETKRFYNFMNALAKAAKKVMKVIFRILPESVVSNYFALYNYGLKGQKPVELKAMSFMELFGLNTMVFLEDSNGNITPPKGGKKSESKINSDLQGLSYLDLAQEAPFKNNLKENIVNAFFQELRTNPKLTETQKDAKVDERLNVIDDYIKSIKANLSLGVSDAYKVANLAVTLMEPHFLSAHQRDILTKGYLEVKDKLPKNFLVKDPSTASKEEIEASERISEMLKGSKPIWNVDGVKKPEGLVLSFEAPALFYAMVKEHSELFGSLGEILINPEPRKAVEGEGAFKKAIGTLAVAARNYMEGSLKKESVSKFINEELQNEEDLFNRRDISFFDRLHDWAQKIDRFLTEKLTNTAIRGSLKLVKQTLPDDLINQIAKRHAQVPISYHALLMDAASFLNNTFVKNQDINTTLAELYGRTTNNRFVQAMLKWVKGTLDKGRSAYLERLPEIIEGSFKRKLKATDRMYLSRVLGSYDVKVFGEDFDELSKLLTDSVAVQAKWDSLKKDLETKYGDLAKPMIQKIEQYGNWKAGNRASGHGLLTNAEAITALLTTVKSDPLRARDKEGVKLVDQLMTLACLKRMSEGDRIKAKEFLTEEKRGVVTIVAWLAASKQHEEKRLASTAQQETTEKTNRNASYSFNYIKGWTPAGNKPKGLYRLIPAKDRARYEAEGYKWLGDYAGSELDNEPMCRMWNPNPYSNDLQEGILQSITQTGFGYQIENGTRGEALGTRILNSDLANKIFNDYDLEQSKNGVIPVFDSMGGIIGYERSIPPEDRQKLEEYTDVITGLGQWYVRQEREEQAGAVNQQLIDHLAQMWHSATGKEKGEFVDVFASTDPHIQKALSRFDQKTMNRIRRAFGEHFWVRRDSVAATIGYYSASPVDMWDSTFFLPKKVQEGIVQILEAILGPKAKYYVGKGFDITRGVVSTIRDTIVIRSIVVPVANIASNIINLHFGLGIPIGDILRLAKESIVATETYSRLYNKKIDLEAALIMPGADKEKIQHQIDNIKMRMENLSVYSLINAGEFSTISSQGRIFEDVEFLKQSRADMIDYVSSKIPKPLQTLTSNVLMTKNSEIYQALTKMVNYGDWIAKCVGYRYLTEKSGTRDTYFSEKKATDIVSTMFVDYDQFMGRGRRFLNDIGFAMFFSFMYRMIPAALMSMMMNPFKTLVGTALGKFTGVGTPLVDNWVYRLFNGNLASTVMFGTLLRGWTLHPLAALIR